MKGGLARRRLSGTASLHTSSKCPEAGSAPARGWQLCTGDGEWLLTLLCTGLLPEIEDDSEWISDIAILALPSPANDFASMRQQFFSGIFEIFDKQLHHGATDLIILDDKQVEWVGIVVTESRIAGSVGEAEYV
jgi:hypothetical protein